MRVHFKRLVEVLAGSSESALRQQVQYLKAENQVLRSRLGGRIKVTRQERARLVKFGMRLGTALASIVTIVKPGTFMGWIRDAKKVPKRKIPKRKPGRPRTPEEIRRLILRIARETGWGFTRIQGELRKLGISTVSRSTIINILKQASMPTAPDRNDSSWYDFLRRHAKTLWACDFMTQRVLTPTGWKEAFLLVFIHLKTRRAYASPATFNPDGEWVAGEVARFAGAARAAMRSEVRSPRASGGAASRRHGAHRRPASRLSLIHDRDGKFGAVFHQALRTNRVRSQRTPHCAPNLNAYAERMQQTLQVECLDKFLVMGTGHLDHLVAEYLDHYNTERPHSGIDFSVPMGRPPEARAGPVVAGTIRCRERLGGVIKHYTRMAA